eukprot:7239594-Alexandrium_andersonii.AAC.1
MIFSQAPATGAGKRADMSQGGAQTRRSTTGANTRWRVRPRLPMTPELQTGGSGLMSFLSLRCGGWASGGWPCLLYTSDAADDM